MLFKKIVAALTGVALTIAAFTGSALASQNSLSSPTTGTVSGLNLTNNYNNALDSVNTCNSGAGAPTNQLSGSPSEGNCWLNTSTGAVQYYDGAQWLTVGYLDTTNHVWTPLIGGGAATTVASAATTNLCGASGAAPQQAYLTISGTTTITGFGSNCTIGQVKVLSFSGALTLTYNATSMILPNGGSNVTTANGDSAVAVYLGGGNWQVVMYSRFTGASLSGASLTAQDQTLSGGANVTAYSIGTESSGTYTVDCGKGPLQYLTDGGAFTLAAPSNDGSCDIYDVNNATAGTITFSGFTVNSNTGEALDTTNGHKFFIHVERINSVATYTVKALQ